jgi:RNA polymerase sigma factor (sigma-70 family)
LVVAGGRGDLAKEATAEAFARLVANAGSVSEPRGWLYRTGYRVVIDELRREQRMTGSVPENAAGDRSEFLFSAELVEALRVLTPAQRLVVFLAYPAGMSLQEIADLTGSPVATVKVRLHRARKALRVLLADEEEADVRG